MLNQNGAKLGVIKIKTFVNQVKRPRISHIDSKCKRGASLYDQENPFVFPLQKSRMAQRTATPQLPQPTLDADELPGWSGIGTLNRLILDYFEGRNLSFLVTWWIISMISCAFLLRSSGIGEWLPSSKKTVWSMTENMASPQWFELIWTGKYMLITLSRS